MISQLQRIFITGTDTGVGKTILSLLMLQFFFDRGFTPFYLKPLQTGVNDPYDTEGDAVFVYRNVRQLKDKDPAKSVIYCYKNPKAPYFAARDEAREREIKLKRIIETLEEKCSVFSPVIIEGAGGVLVPMDKDFLMIDLIRLTGARPVIAARAGLGTINHTLLTLEALERRGLQPVGVVLMDSGKEPTPQDMVEENMEAIEKYSGVKVAGVIGRITDFLKPDAGVYQPFEAFFGG